MLELIDHGRIREIRLARPPANALNGELVDALDAALSEAALSSQAVVVSGGPGMFCAGLDVPELITLDRAAFSRMWSSFVSLMKTIACMPVPTAFALTGHAPAGGLVLALFGDYRIMPRGPWKTGLNEVRVGLIVPDPVYKALVRLIGAHRAERILVSGEMMFSEQAFDIGLIDELTHSPEEAVSRAIEWCESIIDLPPLALKKTREMSRASLCEIFNDYSAEENQSYVDLWFEESSQNALRAMIASLKK